MLGLVLTRGVVPIDTAAAAACAIITVRSIRQVQLPAAPCNALLYNQILAVVTSAPGLPLEDRPVKPMPKLAKLTCEGRTITSAYAHVQHVGAFETATLAKPQTGSMRSRA